MSFVSMRGAGTVSRGSSGEGFRVFEEPTECGFERGEGGGDDANVHFSSRPSQLFS